VTGIKIARWISAYDDSLFEPRLAASSPYEGIIDLVFFEICSSKNGGR